MRLLTLFLILISSLGYSQKVKHIVKRFPNTKIVAEDYYVLKSDKRTKHGEYTSYHKSPQSMVFNGVSIVNKIKQHGFYVKGKKDGAWVETTASGREERGNYTNGVRTGIWDTYANQIKVGSFDYSLNRKIGTWRYVEENQVVFKDYETGETKTEPSFRFIIPYPKKAKEAGIQGTVTVQFHVKPDCTFEEIKVIESVSPECDAEVLKVVKQMEKQGFPKKENCDDSVMTFSVRFELTE